MQNKNMHHNIKIVRYFSLLTGIT